MHNIKIITDSTAYITKEYALEKGIEIVPLTVFFDNRAFEEGFPGEFESFYQKLEVSNDFPTTSQPSIQAFLSTYQKLLEKDCEIIVITISSKLSGTFNSASAAAMEIAPDKISIIDSASCGPNHKLLVEMAVEMVSQGMTRGEIVEILNHEKNKMGIRFTVDTLNYLKKGGRLTSTQAFIGNILNIKPIIALIDGALVAAGKTRGKSNAIEMMLSEIPKDVKQICVAHITNLNEALKIKEALIERFNQATIVIDELGPVVGSHLGPKSIGFCYKW